MKLFKLTVLRIFAEVYCIGGDEPEWSC